MGVKVHVSSNISNGFEVDFFKEIQSLAFIHHYMKSLPQQIGRFIVKFSCINFMNNMHKFQHAITLLRSMYLNCYINNHTMDKANTSNIQSSIILTTLLLLALFYKQLLGMLWFTGAIHLYHHGFSCCHKIRFWVHIKRYFWL